MLGCGYIPHGREIMAMSTTKIKKPPVDFTEGRLTGKMIKFALPLMATALLQSLYNAADMIVVGNFSVERDGAFEMGAVGACGSLYSLFMNLFLGLSVGVGICVAQNIGAKRYEEVKKYLHTSVIMSVICGIVLAVFGFFSAGWMLELMNTPEEQLPSATRYMQAMFVGIPAQILYAFLASALRSAGDSKRPLIFLTISGIVNVVINLIMVAGFDQGALGVGIASAVSQYLSVIMIFVFMLRTSGVCRIYLKELRIHKYAIIGIIQNGLPTGLQSVVFAISNVLIQISINEFGPEAVSGSTAAGNIEGFIYVAMNAVSAATITVVSQNVGAAKYERIKRVMLVSVVLVSAVGILMAVGILLFNQPLLSIYAPGDSQTAANVRAQGFLKLLLVGGPYFLCGIMECVSGALKGMSRSISSMVISIFGSCILRIVWIYTICPFFPNTNPNNITVLYLAYPVTWIVTTAGLVVMLIIAYKKIIKKRDKGRLHENEREEIAV